MYSPWGEVQYKHKITRGIMAVSTAGHGGAMVSKTFAEKNMTKAALKRAIKYGGYYCFEEDCDYSIVVWEFSQYFPEIQREDVYNSLQMWNVEYLLEIGEIVQPKYMDEYNRRKKDEQMRKEKDGNLVVAARMTDNPEITKVWTADDKTHYITGYHNRNHDELNLLSNYKRVEYYE